MNQLRFEYVVLSWNVRGLGETDKCDLVRNAICAAHPHIACLQESKLTHLDANKAKSFLRPNLSDNAMLVCVNANRKIRKCTDTAVVFTREYSKVSISTGNVKCTNQVSKSSKDKGR